MARRRSSSAEDGALAEAGDALRCARSAAILVGAALLGNATCGGDSHDTPERRPVVAVSVLPQAGFVDRLAGQRVETVVMIPPGAHPATFQPTIEQMQAIARADLYVEVGHPNFAWEAAWLERLLAGNRTVHVVNSAEGMTSPTGDPHIWVAPVHARSMAANIAEALRELLPDHAAGIDVPTGPLIVLLAATAYGLSSGVRAALPE